MIHLLLTLPFWGSAQTAGFLGKKTVLGIGTGLNPTIFKMSDFEDIESDPEATLLPPKFNLFIERAISNRSCLRAQGAYYPVPDNSFRVYTRSIPEASVQEDVYNSFLLRTNLTSLNLSLKVYMEYAPYGNYSEFGIGYHRAVTDAYRRTLTTTTFFAIDETSVEDLRHEPQSLDFSTIGIFFSWGRVAIIKELITVDYGWRLNWIFGPGKYDFDGLTRRDAGNHHVFNENGIIPATDFLAARRIRETHFLEFFLNIGILP